MSTTNPTCPESRWELYSHGADIGIRGFGNHLAEAFEAIGQALTSAICNLNSVRPIQRIEVRCAAQDHEALLYEWINAIVYEMAVRRMLFRRYEVIILDGKLSGSLWGEALDAQRHEPAVEVKGATYTDLRLEQDANGIWITQCIIDV